jgi:hypothetical protein
MYNANEKDDGDIQDEGKRARMKYIAELREHEALLT